MGISIIFYSQLILPEGTCEEDLYGFFSGYKILSSKVFKMSHLKQEMMQNELEEN